MAPPFSIDIPVLRSGRPGTFIHVEGEQTRQGVCSLSVVDMGRHYICASSNFFDALKAIRTILEAQGILVLCNGSRKDVWPSKTSREVDSGLVAYVCKPGEPATEQVGIFDSLADTCYGTVSEQEACARQWLESIGAG